jgi:hypothetical protein
MPVPNRPNQARRRRRDAKAKANAVVVSKEELATEVEVEEDMVLTKQAEGGTDDLISEFRDLPSRL